MIRKKNQFAIILTDIAMSQDFSEKIMKMMMMWFFAGFCTKHHVPLSGEYDL